MGRAYHSTCDSCDFEFCSGHSYHEGASDALCLKCDARYCLPTKSSWGPAVDEFIELHAKRLEPVKHRRPKIYGPSFKEIREPTGQHIMAVAIAVDVDSVPFPRIKYAGVDELECTTCKTKGQIVLDVAQGSACPRCKAGTLHCDEIEY